MGSENDVQTARVIVVTGGSRGIGLAIVEHFVRSEPGSVVWYLSRSQAEAHESLSQEAASCGGMLGWVATDMSDEASIEAGIDTVIDRQGRVDVLVNNAGITRDGLIMRMKSEAWDDVLRVNLTGAFIACRRLTRVMMKQRSGCMINISSIVGLTGNGGQTNYAASKAGLIGLSKSLAKELASRGVRVNVVAPGFIETQMTDVLPDQIKEVMLWQIRLGRFGSPEDVASAVALLSSDAASYITGQVLTVDGGMVM